MAVDSLLADLGERRKATAAAVGSPDEAATDAEDDAEDEPEAADD